MNIFLSRCCARISFFLKVKLNWKNIESFSCSLSQGHNLNICYLGTYACESELIHILRYSSQWPFVRTLEIWRKRIKKWYDSAGTAATETRVNVMYPLTETCDCRHVSATVLRVYVKFPFTDSRNFVLCYCFAEILHANSIIKSRQECFRLKHEQILTQSEEINFFYFYVDKSAGVFCRTLDSGKEWQP